MHRAFSLFLFSAVAAFAQYSTPSYNWYSTPSSVASGQTYNIDVFAGYGSSNVTLYKDGFVFATGNNTINTTDIEYGSRTIPYMVCFWDWLVYSSGSNTKNITITAPSAGPSVSFTSIPTTLATNQTFTVSATATDNVVSDLNSLGIRWKGMGLVGGSPWNIAGLGSSVSKTTTTLTAPSTAQFILFRAEVWDLSNNAAETAWTKIRVGSPTTYALNVTSGTGAGSYYPDTLVNISAASKMGYTFSYWSDNGPSYYGYFGDYRSASTTFMTGAGTMNIEAKYTLIPDSTAPTKPGAPVASNVTKTSLTLTWTGSTDNIGVSGYDVLMNGTSIGTVTGTSTPVSGVPTGTTNTWSIRARDPAGNTNTSNGTSTRMLSDPVITTQPVSIVTPTGTNAVFSVVADGNPAPTYQWQQNGTNLTGLTGTGISVNNVQSTSAADFRVVVTNSQAVVNSNVARLTVVTTQPQNLTVNQGASATFSVAVSAVAGSTTTYQWRKNGANIAGATSASYSISSAQAADAATYSVVVSNNGASWTSGGATLAVNVPPTITTPPASQTVTVGNSVTFSVVATGTAPLSYQWRKNGTNIVGATSSSYNIASAAATDAANYSVVVTNAAGNTTSVNATLTVNTTVTDTNNTSVQLNIHTPISP